MKTHNLLLASLLLVLGCTQKTITKTPKPKLFPDGIYTQSVQLQVFPKNKVTRTIPFRNLVNIKDDNFEVKGFTPFGSEAFTAKGNLKEPKNVEIKFFIDMPKFLTQKFINKTFFQIQKIQKIERRLLKRTSEGDFYRTNEFELAIFEYNEQDIPKSMRVKGTRWIAFIELENFQNHQ